jgi:hypothetical protein
MIFTPYELVPEHQRFYIKAHPWVFCACLAFVYVATVGIVAPALLIESPATQVLPEWLRAAFYVSYLVGASLSLLGMVRGVARFEASGMMLLAASFVVQIICNIDFLTALFPVYKVIASSGVLAFFALGSYLRARFLMRHGYPMRIRKDAPGDG